jgi:hypothetical protein
LVRHDMMDNLIDSIHYVDSKRLLENVEVELCEDGNIEVVMR